MTTPPPISSTIRVRYAETDQMGVVYHANYLVWCEIGRTDFIRSLGKRYADMEADGVSLAVAEASVRYHAPARYDDDVRVDTSLVDVRSRTITFEYHIVNVLSGVRLVTARTVLVSLDREGRMVAIPPDVRTMLTGSSE